MSKSKLKEIFMDKDMMRVSGVEQLEIDAVDAVEFRMEQMGWKQADLIPYFGSSSRVSEFLSRKRTPSVQQLRNLYFGMGIPAKVLLQYPSTKK